MKKEDVERFEKVNGQIEGLHREISLLAKKSSNDGLNAFKLKMLNAALASANTILDKAYKPIDGFEKFDLDDVPSNSDATIVLTAYLEELERWRADHLTQIHSSWYFILDDGTQIRSTMPKKLQAK